VPLTVLWDMVGDGNGRVKTLPGTDGQKEDERESAHDLSPHFRIPLAPRDDYQYLYTRSKGPNMESKIIRACISVLCRIMRWLAGRLRMSLENVGHEFGKEGIAPPSYNTDIPGFLA
jgi:hypothetical protein